MGAVLCGWSSADEEESLRDMSGNDLSASCLSVTFIFFTLMLFPINIWIFELNEEFINPHWLGLLRWLGGVCPLCHLW